MLEPSSPNMNPSRDIVEVSIGGPSSPLLGVSGDILGAIAEAVVAVVVDVVRKSAILSNLMLRLFTTLLSSSNLLLTVFMVVL